MTSFSVSNAAELANALKSAQGGDVISLNGGNYGNLSLSRLNFASDVTIKSADASAPATFSTMLLSDVHNVTFDGIAVKFVPDETTLRFSSAVRVLNSSGISVLNSSVEGGPAVNGVPPETPAGGLDSTGNVLGLPTARAFTFMDSTNIRVEGNDISMFDRGIVLTKIDGIHIANNEIHDLRTTPLNGGTVSNAVIDGNHFYNFYPWRLGGSGDHGDLIHFWTEPKYQTTASQNITITNNFLEQGDGAALLGVYLDDNGNKLGFTGITIQNNIIFNGDGQGIRLENTQGALIEGNSLLQSSGVDPKNAPRIVLADGSTATILDNVLTGLPASTIGRDADGNVYVQRWDAKAGNYYGNHIVDALSGHGGLAEIQFLPGSALAQSGAGSTLNNFDSTPDQLTALIRAGVDPADKASLTFDAGLSADHTGFLDASEARFEWNFGDGHSATGLLAAHSFANPGTYDVTLRVTRPDGSVDESRTTIVIPDPMLLNLDFQVQDVAAIDVGKALSAALTKAMNIDTAAHSVLGYHLGTTAYTVSMADAARLYALDEFTLSFSLKRDSSTAPTGDLMRIHGSWYLTLEKSGDLMFRYDDVGNTPYKVISTGMKITDTAWHEIDFTFDSHAGVATFYIDGKAAGSGVIGGATQSAESWGFSIGNPFGASAGVTIGTVQIHDAAETAAQISGTGTMKAQGEVAHLIVDTPDSVDAVHTTAATTDHSLAIAQDPATSLFTISDAAPHHGTIGAESTGVNDGLGKILADILSLQPPKPDLSTLLHDFSGNSSAIKSHVNDFTELAGGGHFHHAIAEYNLAQLTAHAMGHGAYMIA